MAKTELLGSPLSDCQLRANQPFEAAAKKGNKNKTTARNPPRADLFNLGNALDTATALMETLNRSQYERAPEVVKTKLGKQTSVALRALKRFWSRGFWSRALRA